MSIKLPSNLEVLHYNKAAEEVNHKTIKGFHNLLIENLGKDDVEDVNTFYRYFSITPPAKTMKEKSQIKRKGQRVINDQHQNQPKIKDRAAISAELKDQRNTSLKKPTKKKAIKEIIEKVKKIHEDVKQQQVQEEEEEKNETPKNTKQKKKTKKSKRLEKKLYEKFQILESIMNKQDLSLLTSKHVFLITEKEKTGKKHTIKKNGRIERKKKERKFKVVAVLVLDYYLLSNTGLLSYLVVDKNCRGLKLSKILFQKSLEVLQKLSAERKKSMNDILYLLNTNEYSKIVEQKLNKLTSIQVLKQVFQFENVRELYRHYNEAKYDQVSYVVEIHNGRNVDAAAKKFDPKIRHKIYSKIGFRKLDFNYVEPPQGHGYAHSNSYLLLSYQAFTKKDRKSGHYGISSDRVLSFYAEQVCILESEFSRSDEFKAVQEELSHKKTVLLKNLPW